MECPVGGRDYKMGNLRIGVLKGGISSEREISLLSGKEVANALQRKGFLVKEIDITTSCKEKVKEMIFLHNIDVAFISLHGKFGEDGQIQRILEEMRIPYTGSPPFANYLAMDKIASKKIFLKHKIPTANFFVLEKKDVLPGKIKFPVVVKPYFSGSSIGVSIVYSEKELRKAVDEAFLWGEKVIIEDYIPGRELTVGILEEIPLEVIEIVSFKDYFDFSTKYSSGRVKFEVPARLEKNLYLKVQEVGLRAHRSLGCRHFSRVDIRLSKDNIPYVLEVNSIPGLTSHSLLPLGAKLKGIEFDDLVTRMVELAIRDGEKEFFK